MTGFMIFTTGRTGSSAIAEELNGHPSIVSFGEIARPNASTSRSWPEPLHARAGTFGEQVSRQQFSSWLTYLSEGSDKTVGFKALAGHMSYVQGWMGALKSADWSVIWLTRNDVLRQIVSTMVAEKTGIYNSRIGPPSGRRVHLDPEELVRRVKGKAATTQKIGENLEAKGLRTTHVTFEEYRDERASFHRKVQNFLDVPYQLPAPTTFQVMTPEPLSELLTNYEDIVRRLRESDLISDQSVEDPQ